MKIEVRLYATLRMYAPSALNGILSLEIAEDASVNDLIEVMKIPQEEVHLIMINGIGSEFTCILQAGDRVGLFPPVGGG